MADSARGQLREQMGPEFDDIDWQQFDPRQYDPRRIVREALLDDDDAGRQDDVKGQSRGTSYDPTRPTPFDTDAT
jgi:sec-independent protein translocase protein TatB